MESPSAVTKRVLIVDDEPSVVEMLREFLRQFRHGHDYVVEAVLNGAHACDAVLRARPDLVLLDMNMPGMDGLEVLKEIRAVDRTIPVIMITGNRDTQAAADAHAGGVFAYIPKPFDLRHLDLLVGLALQNAAAPPPRPSPPPSRPAAEPRKSSPSAPPRSPFGTPPRGR